MELTSEKIIEIIKEEVESALEEHRKPKIWKSTRSHPFTKQYTGQDLLDYHDLRPKNPTKPFETLPDGTKVFIGRYKEQLDLIFRQRDDGLYELFKIKGEEV